MRSKKHCRLCKESKQSKEQVISARFIERLYECPFCANGRPFLNKARLIKSSQPCHVEMKRETREHKHSPLSIAWMRQLTASERGFWKCIDEDESEAVVEVTTKSGVSQKTLGHTIYPARSRTWCYCIVGIMLKVSLLDILPVTPLCSLWCYTGQACDGVSVSLRLPAATPPRPISILITYCRAALYSPAMMQCF